MKLILKQKEVQTQPIIDPFSHVNHNVGLHTFVVDNFFLQNQNKGFCQFSRFSCRSSKFKNSSCRKSIKHDVEKSWESLRKPSNNLSLTRKGFRMGYRRHLDVNENWQYFGNNKFYGGKFSVITPQALFALRASLLPTYQVAARHTKRRANFRFNFMALTEGKKQFHCQTC